MRYLTFMLLCTFFGCIEPSLQTPSQPSCQVLVFTASWCSACQCDKPQIEELKKHVDVITIDAEAYPDQIRKYQIKLLPTYILVKNGIEQMRANDIHEILRAL